VASEDSDWPTAEVMALRYALTQLRRQDVGFRFDDLELVIAVVAELYVATMMRERAIVGIFAQDQRAEYENMPVLALDNPALRVAAAAQIDAVLANAMLIGMDDPDLEI
jgi:hypothetical protein